MLQPFININWIKEIKQNILKIVAVPQRYSFNHLPGNDHLVFTDKNKPSQPSNINSLPDLNKNEEIFLHDIFGAINY